MRTIRKQTVCETASTALDEFATEVIFRLSWLHMMNQIPRERALFNTITCTRTANAPSARRGRQGLSSTPSTIQITCVETLKKWWLENEALRWGTAPAAAMLEAKRTLNSSAISSSMTRKRRRGRRTAAGAVFCKLGSNTLQLKKSDWRSEMAVKCPT
jgi:hypothetical protein